MPNELTQTLGDNPATPNYYQSRMDAMGITPDINKIELQKTELQTGKPIMVPVPIFTEVPEGIDILVYTLDRCTIRIEKNGSRQKKDFSIVRLEKPKVTDKGKIMKYRLPKGGGTYPFFPPWLVQKFEDKTPISTLYMVEGYFKAFKAAMHGADIIGLSSITHMKDDKGNLHPDILKLILACGVQRVVWLVDGDALDITKDEITDTKDLYTRPKQFFTTISTFKNLLDDYEHIEKWFMHIDTDAIVDRFKDLNRDDVKGIDDLLQALPGKENEIITDLQSVSSSSSFFQKFNITYTTNKVYHHFHLRDAKDFYLFHVERRKDLKGKQFKFNGTLYEYDEEKGDCQIKIPGDANLYFRVADDYYKFIDLPNQHKKIEKVFNQRKKSTIVDDHGRDFAKHIPKYESFCNVPDHNNFQQVIHNCFNVYSPIDFFPDDEKCYIEDFPGINSFVQHIFGDHKAKFTDPQTKEVKEYTMYELGMDYLQILYQKPQQKLPILCLVSRENNTGKSTFANFLRLMLGANVAIVGNADMQNDFNAHWATKSVVVCDETKIDKAHVIEKIKSLSTAKKIFINAKGRGQVELDCFIKFCLITNNEDNFIYATDDDIRYWVLKVPVLQSENPHILDQFVEEMPAFLSYLNHRKLATEHKNRMWFHPNLLKTPALQKVIEYSESTMKKEIKAFLRGMFLDTGLQEIKMALKVVHKEIFNNRFERNYLENTLKNQLKVEPYHVWVVEGLKDEYLEHSTAMIAANAKYGDDNPGGKVHKKYKVIRYTYPRWDESITDGKKEVKRFELSDTGRPYVFYRADFVKDDDVVDAGPENEFINDIPGPKDDVELPF